MQVCVADADLEQRIVRRKAVPLTFSDGGQFALEIWFQQPDDWSALVLDAAYSIDYRNVLATAALAAAVRLQASGAGHRRRPRSSGAPREGVAVQ
jgi:hypothetical protein